jgi:hypothetical protein
MQVRPGPLSISPSLHDVLRLCRSLAARDAAAATDVAARGSLALELASVNAIESELGATLPDDVLVVLAARMPILDCASGLRLDGIVDAAETAVERAARRHRPLPDDLVVIGTLYCEPFAEREDGAHGGDDHTLAIPRSGDANGTRLVVDGHDTTLAELMRDKITAWYRKLGTEWFAALHALTEHPFADDSFQPRLVGELVRADLPVRLVTHAKWGRGRVVSELDGGKLVVDFDEAGRKTLLSRFVEDA